MSRAMADDALRAQKASKNDIIFQNLAASRIKNNNNSNGLNTAEKQIYAHHNQQVFIFYIHKNISDKSS